MHQTIMDALRRIPVEPSWKIADVGAYNINGAVKDLWPWAVGFDIVEGPGVDVVIPRGEGIPTDHWGLYDLVISTGTLQCNHELLWFMIGLESFGKPGGMVFVSMCGWSCRVNHSTSPGTPSDRLRLSWAGFNDLLEQVANPIWTENPVVDGHEDMIFYGRLR